MARPDPGGRGAAERPSPSARSRRRLAVIPSPRVSEPLKSCPGESTEGHENVCFFFGGNMQIKKGAIIIIF